MNARTTAPRSLALVAVAAAGIIALTGCKIGGGKDAASGTPTTAPTAQTSGQPNNAAKSAKPSPSHPGGSTTLPDVCTLLSRAEVGALAGGKDVIQVDPDGAKPGDSVRHCQWQMSGARLAIFLSPTTVSEFTQAHGKTRAVPGIGDAAYMSSGHLFVRHGNIQLDVYATSGSDAAGEKLAKAAATKVVERL